MLRNSRFDIELWSKLISKHSLRGSVGQLGAFIKVSRLNLTHRLKST